MRHKLVRDRIPEIISNDGNVAVTYTLDDAGLDRALKAKLLEECADVISASDPSDLPQALADVLEVVYALSDRAE